MDDLQQLEEWVGPLLERLSPASRGRLARKIGMELRRSTSARIARQQSPDGSAYVPRKTPLRARAGQIKRRRMFDRLRQAKHLKVSANPNEVTVGFLGRVGRIARVHQEGRTDSVRQGGPRVRYEQRILLGFSSTDRQRVKDLLIDHLASV